MEEVKVIRKRGETFRFTTPEVVYERLLTRLAESSIAATKCYSEHLGGNGAPTPEHLLHEMREALNPAYALIFAACGSKLQIESATEMTGLNFQVNPTAGYLEITFIRRYISKNKPHCKNHRLVFRIADKTLASHLANLAPETDSEVDRYIWL